MIYWQNRILTNVKMRVSDICKNVVSTESSVKAKFPALIVKVTSNGAIADDFEFEENAVRCVVTIDAYAKTSLQDAIKILDSANEAMYMMGFKRRQGPVEITNEAYPEISRVTARYFRVIGADDTIKLFDLEG